MPDAVLTVNPPIAGLAAGPRAADPPVVLPPASNAPISLQDVMSAGLASLIAAVTLVLLCYCFWGASAVSADHFKNEKDILALALGLLGTVTGYYFGRTPAEHQAQQATRAADTAQGQLTKTQDQLTAQQDKVTGAQVSAQTSQQSADKAQQKADAIKAEVARELAALTATDAPVSPFSADAMAQDAPAPSLTSAQVQGRLNALLARVNMIG